MDLPIKDGWIEVITGSMYAGKTEELIRRIKRIEYAKKKVLVFKPKIDDRYSANDIVSHSNNRIDSIVVKNPQDIRRFAKDKELYAVAIDEAQFFKEELISVCEHLANQN